MNIPKPYDGAEKYIFVSYSHRDTAEVFPVIERLISEGYRVWFDQGIDPGTEWDENIANHICSCGYFVAFISKNYLQSNNCKDELNYARDLEKDRLIVYLEEVQLPPGLAMRVNRLQSIFRYSYKNAEEFYEKLFSSSNINTCKGEGAAPTPIASDSPENRQNEMPKKKEKAKAGEKPLPKKNKKTAILIAIFCGWLGIHRAYMYGKVRPFMGILMIIMYTALTAFTYLGIILALLDVVLLWKAKKEFSENYYSCEFSE